MSAPNPTEIVALINQTDDLRSTCTICLVVSLLAALPIVVTGLVVKERRRFPSRVTTLFMIKIMLMDIVVLLGSAVDYRIPNDINAMLFPNASQMSSAACVAQALSYQFLIWCIMMYWVVIAFCLFKVVTSDSDVQNFRHIERACYLTVYGCATVFTVIPLILNYSQDSRIFKADNKMLWCWLTAETENVSQPLSSHMSFVPFSQIIFFYCWLLVAFCVGITFSARILSRLCGMRVGGSGASGTSTIITDYIIRHSMFIVVFLIVLGVVLAFAIRETLNTVHPNTTQEDVEFVYLKLHIIIVCSLGTWSFTVFGTSKQICGIWKRWARSALCCCGKRRLDVSSRPSALSESFVTTTSLPYTTEGRSTSASFSDD